MYKNNVNSRLKKIQNQEQEFQKNINKDDEDEFYFKQLKLKSSIRISKNRPELIDLISKNVSILDKMYEEEDTYAMDFEKNPVKIIEDCKNYDELNEVLNDIKIYIKMDLKNVDFWYSLKYFIQVEIMKLLNKNLTPTINKDILPEIINEFENKTYNELLIGEKEIKTLINTHNQHLDIEYWDYILYLMEYYKSKVYLLEYHDKIIKKYKIWASTIKKVIELSNIPTVKMKNE